MRKTRGWKVWVERSADNWRCRWSGSYGSGQKVFVFKEDAAELEIAKKREFQRRDAGLPALPGARKEPDFPRFRESYLTWLGSRRAPGTKENARRSLLNWVEFAGAKFPVTKKDQQLYGQGVTVDDFCNWLLTRRADLKLMGEPVSKERALSPNYARILLRHLKAAFRWAHRESYIEYDPFVYFEFPAAVPVARVITPEHIVALLRNLPDTCRRCLYFTLHTGLRISEVLRLDWTGIERVEGQDDAGKPLVKWYLTVIKSKTRHGRPKQTKTQRIHSNAVQVMGEIKASGPLFDVKAAWLQRRLRRSVVKLGLGRVRWHDLRHTWATNFMDDVRDLKGLMDAGGWATEHAAMIYQHGTQRRVDSTAEVKSKVSPKEALGG